MYACNVYLLSGHTLRILIIMFKLYFVCLKECMLIWIDRCEMLINDRVSRENWWHLRMRYFSRCLDVCELCGTYIHLWAWCTQCVEMWKWCKYHIRCFKSMFTFVYLEAWLSMSHFYGKWEFILMRELLSSRVMICSVMYIVIHFWWNNFK